MMVSVPLKFAGGIYCRSLPTTLIEPPLVGPETTLVVSGSLSGSMSLAWTGMVTLVVSSFNVILSVAAMGGSFVTLK